MRSFFYRLSKNLTSIYLLCFFVLSYRLTYNEFYYEINEEVEVSISHQEKVYPSGEIVGIYTLANGVFVIDTCEIENEEGEFINPTENKIKSGDYILSIDGVALETKEDMIQVIKACEGEGLEFQVSRDGELFSVVLEPVLSKSGEYMMGIWIKDDLAGVGTITYIAETGEFAALGHGMGNGETSALLEVKGGDIYIADIIGIEKGEKGSPGEVKGVIKYGSVNHLGKVADNSGKGIYGVFDEDDMEEYEVDKACTIGCKQEIESGAAQIISEISGERKYYDIEITYIDYLAVNSNKGLHITVVDEELLELTGGIVQGMSGSPIIQNGKLIGAVTHVLINDPTSGYGIFIEEMLVK